MMLLPCLVAGLLMTFNVEVERAGVESWRPWLAAQIRQESACRPNARSPVGAQGLTQFMPPTWRDVAPQTKPSCAGRSPFDPPCAIRAQILYMTQVRRWVGSWATESDRVAASLAGYNGGAGWVKRERRVCRQEARCSPSRWWGNVEKHCLRSAANCHENRDYPVRIFRYAGMER